jgi:uncharacterized protein (DUF1330 family)
MPKGYIIAQVTVKDPEEYAEYVRRAPAIFERFGGRYVVRGGRTEVPEGETRERQVVIEFPSFTKAWGAYNDPEYQKAAEIRRKTADATVIVVEGHE